MACRVSFAIFVVVPADFPFAMEKLIVELIFLSKLNPFSSST